MTILPVINQLREQLITRKLMLVTVESCTGGEIAQVLTSVAGSSTWFERGYVTYSNEAKIDLGVNSEIITKYGAVSEQTVREMAEAGLKKSLAQISLAITGIAGPDGGTSEKPVGSVWFGWAGNLFLTQTQYCLFQGDRNSVRDQATYFALKKLTEILTSCN